MARVPTIAEEDAKRPNRPRGAAVKDAAAPDVRLAPDDVRHWFDLETIAELPVPVSTEDPRRRWAG
jgi:hypothetical protein